MIKKASCVKAIMPLLILCIYSGTIYAQSCTCDTTIKRTTHKFYADAVKPGETICIDTGVRTQNLVIYNVKGAPGNRITIKPSCGGKAIFKLPYWMAFGIKFENSKHFRFTGTGGSAFYGILIDSSRFSLQLGGLSSDFEVDHIEIKNAGFSGIMAKTDSSGPRATGFKMKNVSFHHNYIHKTKDGEGFYIGSTGWTVDGHQHDIDSLELYENITDSTGSEGIQVGCTYSGNAKIYNNRVTNAGYNPFAGFQSNGIQISSGFSGWCYNNYVENTGSNGIIVLGVGNIYVVNNVIVRPGDMGIYTGKATAEAGKHFYYLHNTILMDTSKDYVIRHRPDKACTAYIYNNAVVRPPSATGRSFYRESGSIDTAGNVVRRNISDFHFEDPAADNYDILTGSAAIDSGINVAAYGINDDFEYRPRPVGNYDAGAYEYQGAAYMYRVNSGGQVVADTPINWEKDKQTDPCDWLAEGSTNYVTGSDLPWSGTNNTDAPSQIFSTNRFGGTHGAQQVNYEFPVANGSYEVRLYFAENNYQAAGQRVFDVMIEGITKMDNFDIYATAGYRTAYKAAFTVNVNDGLLDLDLIRGTNNPQINGIAIQPAGTVVNGRNVLVTATEKVTIDDKIMAYPVPLQNKLYVQKQGRGFANSVEAVDVKLINGTGLLIYQGKHRFTGGNMNPVDLSSRTLPPGVYFLQLSGPTTNQVIRLMKQ